MVHGCRRSATEASIYSIVALVHHVPGREKRSPSNVREKTSEQLQKCSGHFQDISRIFRSRIRNISRHVRQISRKYPGSVQHISQKFDKFPGHVQEVSGNVPGKIPRHFQKCSGMFLVNICECSWNLSGHVRDFSR